MVNNNSLSDLYKLAMPAMESKKCSLKAFGYKNIRTIDIWNYLVENLWDEKSMTIDEIVNDIIRVPGYLINEYVHADKKKTSKSETIFEDLL